MIGFGRYSVLTMDGVLERRDAVAVVVQAIDAGHARRRAALELRADSVAQALAELGVPEPGERLIAPRTAHWALALEGFREESLLFVDEPTVSAFEQASGAAGAGGEVWWLVAALEGPELRVPDLRALACAAHGVGARLAVDNTALGRFGCDALALGADVVIEPAAAPDDAAQQRRFDHARAVAEYLRCHPRVPRTWYPGFKANADYQVAARTLRHGFGPRVVFELPEDVAAAAFLERCECGRPELPQDGSLTRLSALDSADGRLVCLIAGLDDPIDVADDLDQAHRWFCNPPEP